MKVVVLGGVAAGTKAAAKLMRQNQEMEVVIINKGADISYAGCGLPYYVGHVIENEDQLIVNSPAAFEKLTQVQVKTNNEAVKVDTVNKNVTAKDLLTGEEREYAYDKLVIATGARPLVPELEGIDHERIFYMRTPQDAVRLRKLIDEGAYKKAVVVGAGYIGLEIAENLKANGIRSFVLDMMPHVLPGFDADMADLIERKLTEQQVPVVTGVEVTGFEPDGESLKVLTSKRAYKADFVVMSAGIRPNTEFLQDTPIEMFKGVILTDASGMTNVAGVYAAGDCAMVRNAITGKPAWSPMGSTANIVGRDVALNISGIERKHAGVLGTAVCKLPGMNVGRTGLTEEQAAKEGFDVVSVVTAEDDKAHYMPGAAGFITKMIADRKSMRLLGIQVIGQGNVDKMVDIAVTGISLKATLMQLADMDLSYAPPFSTAIHPLAHTLNVLMNKIDGTMESFTPGEYLDGEADDYRVIDTCKVPSIEGAIYVNLTDVTGVIPGVEVDEKLLLVCNRGRKAYLLQNRMKAAGYKNTRVLEGGIAVNDVEIS